MTVETPAKGRRLRIGMGIAMMVAGLAAPLGSAMAQVTTVDPDAAIDSDIGTPPTTYSHTPQVPEQAPVDSQGNGMPVDQGPVPVQPIPTTPAPVGPNGAPVAADSSSTYHEDDLIGAAEGVFGKGAKGLAGIIEKILKDQGQPNAYISGREASGAFVVGLRYGSGTLNHKIEGKREVYWTGPSIGFDVGGNAANTFVLVYNLYDSQDLYHRFPAAEGTAYLVGGFTASYLRWGSVVLIPIRLGVGYRLGVNAGYMKFSEKRTWLPF